MIPSYFSVEFYGFEFVFEVGFILIISLVCINRKKMKYQEIVFEYSRKLNTKIRGRFDQAGRGRRDRGVTR